MPPPIAEPESERLKLDSDLAAKSAAGLITAGEAREQQERRGRPASINA
jgi:hypothetical protein